MIADSLKNATKELHETVEKLMFSDAIFNKTISLNQYKKLIFINHQFHKCIEENVHNALTNDDKKILAIEERKKLPALEKDMFQLQLPTVANEEENFLLANVDEALGAMYVMEGATLGGNVIKKHLKENINFENISFQYYGVYGNEIGTKWKDFITYINQHVADEKSCVNGAVKAFELLKNISKNAQNFSSQFIL